MSSMQKHFWIRLSDAQKKIQTLFSIVFKIIQLFRESQNKLHKKIAPDGIWSPDLSILQLAIKPLI